ncbi:MAG TPA: protein kinase [Steroidobacteraceae bacterium]|nr:protein kinase [Steroidobacteraceae bacterium]
MSEVWTRWEGHIVNGVLPLRRYLGGSDHSGVFLTGLESRNIPNAALKLVPVIPTLAQLQLAHWRTAAAAAHPNLMRVLETGRCQLGEQHFLYFVMEYAEQNLGQLLLKRAMTEDEAREMLLASLDALAFLHSLNLVQGQFKPSNVLVVGDRLKLSSDTIRPAGEANASISMSSPYDPPEARDGSFSPAGDLWAVGMTTFEALTQTREGSGTSFPSNFPPTLAEIVRRCLAPEPSARPRAREVEGWLKYGLPASAKAATAAVGRSGGAAGAGAAPAGAGRATGAAAPVDGRVADAAAPADRRAASGGTAAARAASAGTAAAGTASTRLVIRVPVRPDARMAQATKPQTTKAQATKPQATKARAAMAQATPLQGRSSLPWVVGALAAVVVGWFGLRAFKGHEAGVTGSTAAVGASHTASSSGGQLTPPRTSAPNATGLPSVSPVDASSMTNAGKAATSTVNVIHEEIPVASAGARATIRGHVKVSVRVTVDAAGKVVGETLTEPGPSRYFARLATQAARKWRFGPASGVSRREHVLRFEFGREGATGRVVK